jgi:hypothetical protein
MNGFCTACGKYGIVDKCHIKSKGSGGTTEDHNMVLMDREHHNEQHRAGWAKMLDKYPLLLAELGRKGWELQTIFGVQKLVRK